MVFSSMPLNISFRWGLVGNNLVSWYNLVAKIAQVRLNDRGDVFKWGLLQNGIFSVHSLYSALICNGHVRQNRTLWKTRISLKIKIFMWYLHRGVVLTKDNLAKLNWHGSKKMCVLFTWWNYPTPFLWLSFCKIPLESDTVHFWLGTTEYCSIL